MQGARPSDIWWKPDSQLLEHWFSILDARGNYLMKLLSRVRLFATPWTVAHQAPLSMGFSRQEYWSESPSPSPGDLPDQGWNLSIFHFRWILYPLSHQKVKVKVVQSCPTLFNPMDNTVYGILQATILEWVAIPFSRGSSQHRDRTQVSPITGGFFTS